MPTRVRSWVLPTLKTSPTFAIRTARRNHGHKPSLNGGPQPRNTHLTRFPGTRPHNIRIGGGVPQALTNNLQPGALNTAWGWTFISVNVFPPISRNHHTGFDLRDFFFLAFFCLLSFCSADLQLRGTSLHYGFVYLVPNSLL